MLYLHLAKVVELSLLILFIELMNAAQGIDFRRSVRTSKLLERFLGDYRKEATFARNDVAMYQEVHKTVAFLNRIQFDY